MKCAAACKGVLCQPRQRVDDKIFVREKWVDISSGTMNKLIGAPDHEEDEHSVFMNERFDTTELVEKLCQSEKEVNCIIGKNNQNLSFNVGVLQPSRTPLFKLVCYRLIPTTHTFHITLDSAIFLYTIIQKRKVDTGWIIYNIMINSVKPYNGLCFFFITQSHIQDGMEV